MGYSTKKPNSCGVTFFMLHGHGIFFCLSEGRAKESLFRNKILRMFEPQAIELARKLRNLLMKTLLLFGGWNQEC